MAKTNHSSVQFTDAVTDTRTSTQGAQSGYSLGLYREEDGRGYRYVQFDNGAGNVAAVVGNLCYQSTTGADLYKVTMDVSDSDRNAVMGVFVSIIPDLGYGWIQTKGYFATVKTNADDDIAAWDAIIASAAGDGTCDSTAQDTAPICKVVGWAVAADVDAADTVAVNLTLD